MQIAKLGSCPTENYLNFLPSYFPTIGVDAAVPTTPFPKSTLLMLVSVASDERVHIQRMPNSVFQESCLHTHLAIKPVSKDFFSSCCASVFAQHRPSSLFPPQRANLSSSCGTGPCFVGLSPSRQDTAARRKERTHKPRSLAEKPHPRRQNKAQRQGRLPQQQKKITRGVTQDALPSPT